MSTVTARPHSSRNPWMFGLACFLLGMAFSVLSNRLSNARSGYPVQPLPAYSAKTKIPFSYQTTAKVCPAVNVAIPAVKEHLKSQQGEDTILLKWFNGLCEGTYLEMGALDGKMFSNTYFFNRVLQWKGLLVELSPNRYSALKANRPNELAVVNAAVCNSADPSSPELLHYYDRGAVSGVWEFSTETFRKQWWPNVTIKDTKPVACRPLHDIMDREIRPSAQRTTVGSANNSDASSVRHHYFDFMSLDCEGCESTALLSIDWTRTAFGVICMESDRHNQRKNLGARSFLQSHGYVYMGNIDGGGPANEWYFHEQFHAIYENLMYTPQETSA
jgi:Methyltransferase FkbM domain